MLSKTHPATLKKLEEVMIPPDGVKRKLDAVVDNVPSDKDYEVLDGKLTEEEWDKDETETVADSDDEEDIAVSENDISTPEGESMPESESISVDPELKAELDCLNRIESTFNTQKKSSSTNLLPFLVRVENMLAGERKPCKAAARKTRKQTKLKNNVNSTAVLKDNAMLLTFSTGDNLFLLDICSYFLFLKDYVPCEIKKT